MPVGSIDETKGGGCLESPTPGRFFDQRVLIHRTLESKSKLIPHRGIRVGWERSGRRFGGGGGGDD